LTVFVALPSGGLVSAEVLWDAVQDRDEFPFSIPALRALHKLDLSSSVTFLVGENGSGKSTLLEAIAVVAGLNAEGGARNLRFSNRATESRLHEHLRLSWRTRQRWAFFLRAETFFDTATAYEQVGVGGFHERSHGEQFIEAALEKFQPGGLHLLDEPEAALSILGQLKMMRRIHDVVAEGGQFVIATHSPILLAFPDARIYEFAPDGLSGVGYQDTEPYQLTKSFLEAPERFLRHLFADDEPSSDDGPTSSSAS
jgi:predicted ATPase